MKWRENVPFTPLTERVTKIEHRRPSCAFQQIRWKLYALRACRYGDCKGLTAFALTDHDTTAGVKEAVAYGRKKGIEVIPGIEFSTEYYGKDIHIVGLFIDEDAPAFQEQIGNFVRAREERNEKMCARLAATASISAMKSCWKPFRTASSQEGITPDICSTTAMSKACRKRSTAISGIYQIFCSPGKNHARPGGFPDSRRQRASRFSPIRRSTIWERITFPPSSAT